MVQQLAQHVARQHISAQVHHSDVSGQSGSMLPEQHAPQVTSSTSFKMKVEPLFYVYRGRR